MDKTKLNKHFILASSSQRRLELLSQIGVKPDLTLSPNIDEKIFSKELPRIYVERMSLEKNRVFQQKYPEYSVEYIKKLLWNYNSKINNRISNNNNETYKYDDWKKIKLDVTSMQKYILKNYA